jgi:nucleoside-diphosphate-sugar epimerase
MGSNDSGDADVQRGRSVLRNGPGRGLRPKVLITGAAGYTGLALACHLLAGGHGIRALARRPMEAKDQVPPGIEFATGDIRDRAVVERAVEGVDTVYHLAAVFRRAGVPDSEYRTVHVDATRHLVECSAAAGVKRFVHCSTVGVHGDVERDAPATEDAPFKPGDIYQETKLEGEQVAIATAQRVGLPLTVVRPGPIYGPGERRFLKMIGGVARGRFLLVGDGSPRFQMVYVEDLVRGMQLAAETEGAIGKIYILTGDEAPTLNELVHEIADVAQVRAPRVHLPVWPVWLAGALCEAVCVPFRVEPPIFRRRVKFFTSNRWFDTSRARTDLGFAPKISLRQGLLRTLQSYKRLGWV